MGRRRRGRKRRVYRPRKKIPSVFSCPQCGRKGVGVAIDKKEGVVRVKCGYCSLEASFRYEEGLHPVDYYSKFVDAFYEGVALPVSQGAEATRSGELPEERRQA